MFFPLSLVFYAVAIRPSSTFLFAVESALLGGLVACVAFRLVRLAWQRE